MQSAPEAALPTASLGALGLGLLAVGCGLVGAVATDLVTPASAGAAGLCYLVAAALVGRHWRAARFGVANTVTLARLVCTCWIAGFTVEAALRGLSTQERLLILALASFCLVLDGVDGRLARARGEVSDFGARFDMETDALLLFWLSLAVPILGVAGWWAVAIAGLRYAYLVASWLIPALGVRLTESIGRRKAVAVIGLLAPVLALAVDLTRPGWAPALILTTGLVCLVWSFTIDIAWQLGHHRTGELASRTPPVITPP